MHKIRLNFDFNSQQFKGLTGKKCSTAFLPNQISGYATDIVHFKYHMQKKAFTVNTSNLDKKCHCEIGL